MKKIITLLTIAITGVASSYGQGYVTVAGTMQNHTNSTLLTTSSAGGLAGSGDGNAIGNIASGQSYYVALLTTTSGTPVANIYGDSSLAVDWLDTGTLGHNTTFNGRFSIGSDYQVNNAPVGQTQNWMLVAWSSSLGSTWSSIESILESGDSFSQSGYLGWSQIGVGAAGAAPNATPLTIQGSSGSIIPNGFTLYAVPVPEPTTIALAGLGGLSLLLFRRRKV